jgi:bacterioferritin
LGDRPVAHPEEAVVQGDPEILEFLNEVLTAELTAVNQYFLHAKMCSNWGYEHLAEKIRSESMDEMRDADALIERILYFDGHPNLQRLGTIRVGETVDEQLRLDLELERAAIERYNRGIELAVSKSDNGTRHLLEEQLEGEESHADWLETQLSLIEQVGLENYLSEQIRD